MEPLAPAAALRCTANVRSGAVTCASPTAEGAARRTILGGQDLNVKLASSNVSYSTADGGVLSADITVQNLRGEAMGGESPVRVFFHVAPVVVDGTGEVTVRNADGVETITGTLQPYFAYPQTLLPGETSAPRRWEWSVPASVTQFIFTVYVDAPLAAAPSSAGLAFRSITAHGENACGVTLAGEGWCWGHTAYGEIGAGAALIPQGAAYRPVRVANGPWEQIATGEHGACGLKQGLAWCWGTDVQGALGTGTVSSGCGGTADYNAGCSALPVKVTGELIPGQTAGGPEVVFTQISAGGQMARNYGVPYGHFTCGLNAGGHAFCWGSNTAGALGNGHQYPAANPAPERVAGDHVFRQIAAGTWHTCAVDDQGKAWCWGLATSGQLGYPAPAGGMGLVPGAVQGGHTFRQVAAGGGATCGVTVEGEVWCWGSNGYGQLGTDAAMGTCNGFECSIEPVKVESDLEFAQVTVGHFHTCAITVDGEALCWGRDTQLGAGPEGENTRPCSSNDVVRCAYTPVKARTSQRFVQIAAARQATCAIGRSNRKVYCWGVDAYPQAQGLGQPRYVPTQIVEPAS